VRDIKDIKGDIAFEIKTIPSVISLKKTKVILYLLTLFASGCLIYGIVKGLISSIGYMNLALLCLSYFYLVPLDYRNAHKIYEICLISHRILDGLLLLVINLFMGVW